MGFKFKSCPQLSVLDVFVVSGVFDVLAYTDKDLAVPFTWMESDPKLIANPQMVKLHSFDTKVREWDFVQANKIKLIRSTNLDPLQANN